MCRFCPEGIVSNQNIISVLTLAMYTELARHRVQYILHTVRLWSLEVPTELCRGIFLLADEAIILVTGYPSNITSAILSQA